MAGFGSYQNPEIIQQQTLVTSIPVGQWSGSDGNYYITVTASGITADSIIVPNYDKDSAIALQGPIWCVPGAGSFTINTTKLPTNTVNIMTQFAGTMGVANYQVLADVYSRSQIDNKIANDLGTTVEGKILDARQGKILNDNKANVSDVYSKSQAVAKADIVNDLTSIETQKPGSANMLHELKTLIDSKIVRITGSITSTGSVVDTTIDLPSGYTYANSVIVGFGYATSASEYRHGNNAFGNNERVFARLTIQNKAQVTSNYNGTAYIEVIIAKIA